MSTQYSPQIVTNGLVLALDAGNPKSYVSGSVNWSSLVNRPLSGSLINGPTFNTGSGGSIVFDGSNDYVDCGNIMPSAAYTKCVWFYITSLATNNNLISGGGNGTHYFYPQAGNNYLRAGHFQGAEITSSVTFTINKWYFGAVTFSTSSGFVMYQNGALVGTNPSTATFTGGNIVYVGAYGAADNLLTGRIACAQIYNRVLTQAEILQNYNTTKTRFGL